MDDGRGAGAVLIVIRTLAETGSTNADLIALARTGADEGLWLRAERQTAGRGRLGREWVSPVGNLYASTLVRMRPGDPASATLAFVAAVALEEATKAFLFPGGGQGPVGKASITTLSGSQSEFAQLDPGLRRRTEGLCLKWPNDLFLDGAKLSGILLERVDDAVVVGIGVNLAHHPDLPDRSTTSLSAHGALVEAAAFLEILADIFARWLAIWRSAGLAPIRERWLDRAHPVGTGLIVRLPDGTAQDGLFDGLDADGALILRLADGTRRVIHAGDVFLVQD